MNDRTRPIAPHIPTRAECGLPEAASCSAALMRLQDHSTGCLIYGCACWLAMTGSVLWLLESNSLAAGNLRREAEARGIVADRADFRAALPNPEHLARFRSPICFSTRFLTMHIRCQRCALGGLPGADLRGPEAFPSRVAGSLLRAVGLPELVTTSLGEYEALALRLAGDPDRLRSLREKLCQNRLTFPLFDSRRFARHLEGAYAAMWQLCTAPGSAKAEV